MDEQKKQIFEYRGIENLVYAEVTKDIDEENGYTTGAVKSLAGVAELGKSRESTSDAHYYDNLPMIVINADGSDEVKINTSALPLDVLADITGQFFDSATGMFVEGERDTKYYAIGYKTQKTDGTDVYVWRLKGTFAIPEVTHKSKDTGTDAEGQELTYTGISTTKKFTKTGKGAMSVNVDTSFDNADVSNFFDKVQTPDTILAKA